MRWLPNGVSVLRILLVVPTVWSMQRAEYGAALGLVAAAAVSDAVDGYLARRFQWTSELGALLDPIADKLMVAALYLTLTYVGALPLWLLGIVLLRDMVIVGGALCYRLFIGPLVMAPSLLSKTNTFAQFSLVLAALLALVLPGQVASLIAEAIDPWGFALVAALSVSSGLQYVVDWSRRAVQHGRAG